MEALDGCIGEKATTADDNETLWNRIKADIQSKRNGLNQKLQLLKGQKNSGHVGGRIPPSPKKRDATSVLIRKRVRKRPRKTEAVQKNRKSLLSRLKKKEMVSETKLMDRCTSTMAFEVYDARDREAGGQTMSKPAAQVMTGNNFSENNESEENSCILAQRWGRERLCLNSFQLPIVLPPILCGSCLARPNLNGHSEKTCFSCPRSVECQAETKQKVHIDLAEKGIQTDSGQSSCRCDKGIQTDSDLSSCCCDKEIQTDSNEKSLHCDSKMLPAQDLEEHGGPDPNQDGYTIKDVIVELQRLSASLKSAQNQNIKCIETSSMVEPLPPTDLPASISAVVDTIQNLSVVSSQPENAELILAEATSIRKKCEEKREDASNVNQNKGHHQDAEHNKQMLEQKANSDMDLQKKTIQEEEIQLNKESACEFLKRNPLEKTSLLAPAASTESINAKESSTVSSKECLRSMQCKSEKDKDNHKFKVPVEKSSKKDKSKARLSRGSSGKESNFPEKNCGIRQFLKNETKSSEEIRNSPSFEEMDPTELESLLLVWRQQEEMHMNQGVKSARPSSPNFLFRKPKRPYELPPELSSVRILRPPPIKKARSAPSALDILDKEGKEEDDCDVPEFLEQIQLNQTKKRKRLQLKPSPPLKLLVQKSSNVSSELKPIAVESEAFKDEHIPKPTEKEGVTSEKTEVPGICLRSSKKLKVTSTPLKEDDVDLSKKGQSPIQCGEKETAGIKQAKKAKNSNENDKIESSSGVKNNIISNVKTSEISEGKKVKDVQYNEQIQERASKLKRKWLEERCGDIFPESSMFDLNLTSSTIFTPPPSPTPSYQCHLDALLPKGIMKLLGDLPFPEVAKAHDVAVHVILNPWRGIIAKSARKGVNFYPQYDVRSIVRALWDLRSRAPPEEIIERVMEMGWKEVHPIAFRVMTSLFISCLSPNVSFVIEASAYNDRDDSSSTCSEADMTLKKRTPLIVVATKSISKGETITGLEGVLLKCMEEDKSRLRGWIFPKFSKPHHWAVLGPLAYLKQKESDHNTEAIMVTKEVVAAVALRKIKSGERLLVTYKKVEKSLFLK